MHVHTKLLDLSDANVNVSWMDDWVPNMIYLFSVLGCRYLIDVFSFGLIGPPTAWSIVHITHGVISFYILHWMKGSTFYNESKEIFKLTLWEQINGERVFTPTRKFLTIFTILLFVVTWQVNNFEINPVNAANWVVFVVLLIAKLPVVHRVRFLGINKRC